MGRLRFYTSVTSVSSGELRRLVDLWRDASTQEVFEGVIIAPLFSRRSTLDLVRRRAAEWDIIFDSGGYYVQQGLVTYADLCQALLACYVKHPWARYLILPDCVPTSFDDVHTVDAKVRATIKGSLDFFQRLPDRLEQKAVPVVQGHTRGQLARCLDAYLERGFRYMAFGSFGTSGLRHGLNRMTTAALERLAYVVARAKLDGFQVHALGVGNPPTIALLALLDIDSFDTSSWIRTAGHGNVYLPHCSEVHVTDKARLRPPVTRQKFTSLKALTNHHCSFCSSFNDLRSSRYYRAMHNLIVLRETLQTQSHIERLRQFSPRYFALTRTLRQLWRDPMIEIAKAADTDLDGIKALADRNRDALGFIPRAAIAQGIADAEVLVARFDGAVVGFQTYHHRKRDDATKLYFKCVAARFRGLGIGRRLVDAVAAEARKQRRTRLVLKCPVGLPSNAFHAHYGFILTCTEPGKRRQLNTWEYSL